MLVSGLLVKLFGELFSQLVHLALVFFLISFQTFVDLLAFVDGVLLVVLDLLVDVAELFCKNAAGLVTEPHQLVEVILDLIHLVVEAADLQVFNFRLFVHF